MKKDKILILEIKRGDIFRCVKNLPYNKETDELEYTADRIYVSLVDGCITNNSGGDYHFFKNASMMKKVNQHFDKIVI